MKTNRKRKIEAASWNSCLNLMPGSEKIGLELVTHVEEDICMLLCCWQTSEYIRSRNKPFFHCWLFYKKSAVGIYFF